MKVRLLEIANFRGVKTGQIVFRGDALLVGGNNIGKSTVCEALDLVLGPERLYRRPAIDEHDFFHGRYLDDDGQPIAISVGVVLTELSEEAERRFAHKLRRWNDENCTFVDEEPDGADHADDEGVVWALPLIFRGRYDRAEDDFDAETFFDHPAPDPDDLDEEALASLGEGRVPFTRTNKRLCGFVYLRALRTGSRALGLQRGSLLDTVLKLGGEGVAEMWLETLDKLRDLDPAVGEIERLKDIRTRVQERLSKFVVLATGEDSTGFFASELTREHLREVVRLFIATSPSDYPVPFTRQGTGSINLLVFVLLTIIADLKGPASVIFAMEEPEIALPPHTQRRVTRHVRKVMGQTIVTSHSPYVIEQFEPAEVLMLHRPSQHKLTGMPIEPGDVKPKTYRTERRLFAEAILAKGVIVVEGSTEASLLPVISSKLEEFIEDYTHLDMAGVSIFPVTGDGAVPRHGPIFKALGKKSFGLSDKPKQEPTEDQKTALGAYDKHWESPEFGAERLLVEQVPTAVLRRFLDEALKRPDYPADKAPYSTATTDEDLKEFAFKALKAKKGEADGYAALLIEQCHSETELPEFLASALLYVDSVMDTVLDDEAPPDEA
ncbi:MAG: ATP-dependent nuclease [Solirubrobacteraceae bacterium]